MKPKTVGRSDGGLAVFPPVDTCGLLADSIILTLDGERRVADLNVGDRVITRDSGTAVLRGIARHRLRTAAVRIMAGTLGHTRPERDVTLPAGQLLLVRDWRAKALFGDTQALVPATRLVDGEFVTLEAAQEMTLFSLDFAAPHILYVDGLELASNADMRLDARAA
ncbi:Hint domain-containing protein [Roseovarius mucosus]|uniref:Hint domain-containing protein n=1 Tax=Roseovarius mucosus TaxID=215743 RepID=UPI001C5F68AC|nr:Hint domain-containing protein [Roseovarius mucosus]MBW4972442.1 Hint domain-containing protein [Roseovarius mucosus]